MRGEHFNQLYVSAQRKGSSPHARGTPCSAMVSPALTGIIPACAGNTPSRRRSDLPCPGSSPHARGTPQRRGRRQRRHGIIHACAGNTIIHFLLVRGNWDHPRMRGEHVPAPSAVRIAVGSSPHARGTRSQLESGHRKEGIIPACAGNTDCCAIRATRQRDHPRMRGEHSMLMVLLLLV